MAKNKDGLEAGAIVDFETLKRIEHGRTTTTTSTTTTTTEKPKISKATKPTTKKLADTKKA